jgi:maleate isomerase
MSDTLAPRAIIGVMTPAMNTVVQPELEQLRPAGISNQLQRFRLGGERISDDLFDEAEKLMDANPVALAIGLTTDAGAGGVEKLKSVCDQLQSHIGIPVCNA